MEYPYYVIPAIEALPEAQGEERKKLIRKIAALVGNRNALREILALDPEEFAAFYPDMLPPDLSTQDTIDSFLEKYGDPAAAASKEVKQVEELVPLPPADYDLSSIESAPILVEKEETEDTTSSLLDSFLNTPQKTIEPEKTAISYKETLSEKETETPASTKDENPPLSESLARAMIKNGNYRKALEIITDLSLKNPKKSIYFADQIRFLKKLILNQSASQK